MTTCSLCLSVRSSGRKLPLLAGVLITLGGLHAGATPAEQNWGQWRGPQQNGFAPQADPPVAWSESKNVRWKFKLSGEGSATPVIWDDLIFVQTAIAVPKKPEAKINV